MKFDLGIKNTIILSNEDVDTLYIEGVLNLELNKKSYLFFGCPGKPLSIASIEKNNFKALIEIPKNQKLNGVYFIFTNEDKISCIGTLALDSDIIELQKTTTKIIFNQISPNIVKQVNSNNISLKTSVDILKFENNSLTLKLFANFKIKDPLNLKLIELSIADNYFLLPDEINIEQKEGFFLVTASVNCKVNNLNTLSKNITLRIYNNEHALEYISAAEFHESLTLNEPYIKNNLILESVETKNISKNISLIFELKDLNATTTKMLNSINKYNQFFTQVIIISKNEYFKKINSYITDIELIHLEKNSNWLEVFSTLEQNHSLTNILFLSGNVGLDQKNLSLISKLESFDNQVHVPKLIDNQDKILAAGNFIIGNKIIFDYGKGENKSLSKYNFERELLACSDSSFYFSRSILFKIFAYNKELLSGLKLHEIINYLATYDDIQITYKPNIEIKISNKENQFYKSKKIISNVNTKEVTIVDNRKKILILGDSKRINLVKNHILELINKNYLITIITNTVDQNIIGNNDSVIKIEWISDLTTKEINSLIEHRRNFYSATWVLNNSILKVLRNNSCLTNIIFTPDIRIDSIGKYFVKNKILYSTLRQKTIERQILTNEKDDIFSINQFRNLDGLSVLTLDTKILELFLSNEIPINLLNKTNLKLAIESTNSYKENFENLGAIDLENSDITNLIKFESNQLENTKRYIDIILPIYNSYDSVKICIESIFKGSDLPFNLYLVNDCSSDLNIKKLLHETIKREGEGENKKIVLIENTINLGYTRNINLCLSITDNDVLLINSDCILPKNSLSKLFKPIFSNENIATSSPLTNDNSILSLVDKDSSLKTFICNLDNLEKINSLLSANFNEEYTEIPTGVGYCMAISRSSINLVGQYDSELFPKMYGEENDFAIRATKENLKHVAVNNMFVHHYESLSENESCTANKKELQKNAIINLNLSYPGYDAYVNSKKLLNHLSQIKNLVKLTIATQSSTKEFMLIVHNPELKGGSFEFLKDLKSRHSNEFNYLYLLADKNALSITYINESSNESEISLELKWDEVNSDIEVLLNHLRVSKIFVNQINEMQVKKIVSLFQEINIPYDFITHDFLSICPSITLTNKENIFCNLEKNPINCAKCLEGKFSERNELHNPDFILEWRDEFFSFLNKAENVFCPSEDTVNKFKTYYPTIDFKVLKYRENPFINYVNNINTINRENLHIGIIGAINQHKGLSVVEKLYEWIKERDKNINLTVIGYTSNGLTPYKSEDGRLTVTGAYNPILISKILEEVNPDIILGVSLMMETYCYTAREGIFSGFPILSFDKGPVANLVKDNFELGWLTEYGNFEELRNKIDYLNENREIVTKKAIELQKHIESLRRFSYEHSNVNRKKGLLNIVRDGT